MRERWVGAAEAALDLRTARHFMEWLHKFVQPVLQFQMVACGTGLFAPRTVQMDRLLVRGFPRQTIEAWRNPHGVIVLPRAVRRRDGLVYPVEFRVPRQGSTRGGPPGPEGAAGPTGRLAALDRVEIGCGIGSYFLFGSFGQAPGPEQHYLAAILAPVLHAVLTQTLNADVRLRPPAPLGVHLPRRGEPAQPAHGQEPDPCHPHQARGAQPARGDRDRPGAWTHPAAAASCADPYRGRAAPRTLYRVRERDSDDESRRERGR